MWLNDDGSSGDEEGTEGTDDEHTCAETPTLEPQPSAAATSDSLASPASDESDEAFRIWKYGRPRYRNSAGPSQRQSTTTDDRAHVSPAPVATEAPEAPAQVS